MIKYSLMLLVVFFAVVGMGGIYNETDDNPMKIKQDFEVEIIKIHYAKSILSNSEIVFTDGEYLWTEWVHPPKLMPGLKAGDKIIIDFAYEQDGWVKYFVIKSKVLL